jgi:thiamine-monophosphate kinase
VGARVEYALLPLGEIVHDYAAHPEFDACVLSGGDDYELCFTAPAAHHQALDEIGARLSLRLTAIGRIHAESGLSVCDAQGQILDIRRTGYDHFAA